MISILNQERLLGAALGSILTGVVVFEQRKSIYSSIADHQSQLAPQSQINEPIFGKNSRVKFAHLWNKSVDQTFGRVIASLSSRGKEKVDASQFDPHAYGKFVVQGEGSKRKIKEHIFP